MRLCNRSPGIISIQYITYIGEGEQSSQATVIEVLPQTRVSQKNRNRVIEDIIPIYTIICATLGPLIGTIVSGGE